MSEIVIHLRYEKFSNEYCADISIPSASKCGFFSSDSLYQLMDIVKKYITDMQQDLLK
jgi:hypothetical protein